MKRVYRTFATLLIAALLAAQSLGCNTFEGVGEDIEAGGEAVQDAAK